MNVDLRLLRRSVLLIMTGMLAALAGPRAATQTNQDLLAANIDPTVSPGEDFFQYANGAWLKSHPIPDDQPRWGIGNVLSTEVYTRLREISEDVATKPAPRGSAEQLIGDFWAAAMDTSQVNRQALSLLQPDFNRIDQIGSVGDLIDVVAIFHRRNLLLDAYLTKPRVLFADEIGPDDNNGDRRIYVLSQAGISIGRQAYTSADSRTAKMRDALHEYMFKTFVRLHRPLAVARARADVVYDLEAKLARSFDATPQPRRVGRLELSQLAPTIDWNRYYTRLGVSTLDVVEVRQPHFLQMLDSALRTAPLDDWKDYLRFWLVKLNAPFLDDETFNEFFAYESAVTGQPQPAPRWRRLVWQEKNWLSLPAAKLFAERDLSKDIRARYLTLAEAFREAFRDRIQQLDWMSDDTKHQALLKLAALKITIGPAQQGIDFSTMPLGRDSYLLNMIRAAEWFHDWQAKRLNSPIDKTEGDLHPDIGGDSDYDAHANTVHIPSPRVAPGVSDSELDDAFVYGSASLGHEMAHAFDSEGRHYDAAGNKVDWWTAEDSAAFDARAQVLVAQYSEFIRGDGVHVDGRRSLRENMADLVGLRIKLDAFKKTEQFRKNERIGGFTPLQRFFLAWAYCEMEQERPESLGAVFGAGYAPSRERVNGVVVNIPEFYEAFDVKPGDRMYRPENLRATIW